MNKIKVLIGQLLYKHKNSTMSGNTQCEELLFLSKQDILSLQIPMKVVLEAVENGLKLKGEGKVYILFYHDL